MNKLAFTASALLLATGIATAQTKEEDHKAHHPDGAASAAVAKAPVKTSTAAPMKSADMASKMKAMQDMHQKMMAAKTPEERQALMGEHMKAMQAGMGMMKQMSDKAAEGAGGMKGMPGDAKDRMQAMEQRMDMMQAMMEMMMDRMPATALPGSK